MTRINLLLAAVVLLPLSEANAAIFYFGDSLTDTGNLFLATGQTAGPVFSPEPTSRFATPPYVGGKASNGEIWVEQLATILGEAPPVPSLAGGTNFSFIGAISGPPPLSPPSPFPGVPDMQAQVQTYLATNPPSQADDLFVIFGGSNDYIFGQTDPTVAVANISNMITTLHADGAERFLVPNLPLLGATPLGPLTDPDGLNFLTSTHNVLLAAALESLRQGLGVEIIEVDLETGISEIIANPADFGLTNVTDTAFDIVDDPFSPLFGFPASDSVVPDPEDYLFVDLVHPTTEGHALIASAAAAALIPEPASGLSLLGLLVLAVGRRARQGSSSC